MGKILNLASLKAKADAAGVGTTATSTTPSLCPQKSSIASYVTNGSSTVSISGNWANNQLVPEENVAVGKTITSTETIYRNVSIGDTTNPEGDIPASGGRRRAQATVTYEYATKTNYSDGTSSIGEYQQESATIYGGYVPSSGNAPDLGTTFTQRTYKGTSTPSGVVAGATRTATGISIYQEANCITSITPTSSEGHPFHVSYSNISYIGGTVYPTTWGSAIYTFSSGSTYTSDSTTPFTNVSATFTRAYPGFASNPDGAFSLNNNTGAVTAYTNNNSSSRTAIVFARLTVSITYTGSYAGVYTPCSDGNIVHQPSCTQNAYSPPTTGYNVVVSGPSGYTAPILSFYYNSTFRGYAHSRSNFNFTQHNTWDSTGVVDKIFIAENGSKLKQVTITGSNDGTILAKTAIANYIYQDLTKSFNTSDYNNGSATIYITYSNI